MTIPATIHYCWFGSASLPAEVSRCIDTWRRAMPHVEIVRWSEQTWDIEANGFALTNWQRRKYAFVSDVCRLDVLRDHGGIYLDTDVVMKKSLDPFRHHEAFLGMMYSDSVGTAVIGARQRHPLIVELRELYDSLEVSSTPNNDLFTGHLLSRYSAFVLGDYRQTVGDGVAVYPRHYFERFSRSRDRAFTQHLVSNTWHDDAARSKSPSTSQAATLVSAAREWAGNARTIPRAAHFDSWLRHKLTFKRPQRAE